MEISNVNGYRQMLASSYEYQDRLHMLINLGKNLNSLLDIDDIMDALIESSIKLSGAQTGAAALFNRTKVVFNKYGVNGRVLPLEYKFQRGKGISGMVMETKKPYLCNNTDRNQYMPAEVQKVFNIRNFISVPILGKNNEFFGFFEVYNSRNLEPFSQIDVDLCVDLAGFAATAVDNSRLLNEINKFGEEMELLVSELAQANLSKEPR